MIRLPQTARSVSLLLAVLFCLIYGPVCSESREGRIVFSGQPLAQRPTDHESSQARRGDHQVRDDAPKHLRDWVVANYAKGERNCAGAAGEQAHDQRRPRSGQHRVRPEAVRQDR